MSKPDPQPATPRWVKVFGFVTAVLAAAFVAAHLACGGMHHH